MNIGPNCDHKMLLMVVHIVNPKWLTGMCPFFEGMKMNGQNTLSRHFGAGRGVMKTCPPPQKKPPLYIVSFQLLYIPTAAAPRGHAVPNKLPLYQLLAIKCPLKLPLYQLLAIKCPLKLPLYQLLAIKCPLNFLYTSCWPLYVL